MLSRSQSARPRRSPPRRALPLVAALLALLALTPLARAQERAPEITVIQTIPEPQAGATSLPLSIVFSLRDQSGNPLPKSGTSLGNATIAVTTGDNQALPPVEAVVEDPKTPIKIALVLDRSGSMNVTVGDAGGQQRTLDQVVREAAVESINAAPDQAQFAVFSFAEQTELRSGAFLRKSDQAQLIEDAIRSYNTNKPGTGNTCITDAAIEAINYLNANSDAQGLERKALILFTDGIDKEANGSPTNGNDCSNRDFGAVIRSAQLSSGTPIPIYTIWPCTDPCNQDQRVGLEELARETRGKAAIGGLQEVGQLFGDVMALLNSQWVVRANVLASEGPNTATIRIQFGDTFVTGAAPFVSDRSYTLPAEIQVAQVLPIEEKDGYRVTLTINRPETLGAVIANVYTRESGGVSVSPEQRFDQLSPQLDFELPTDGMKAGETYYLRITAEDKARQPIKDPKGDQPLMIIWPIEYDPKLAYTIGAVEPAWDANQLLVAVDARGVGQRSLNFSGQITNRADGAREDLAATALRDGQLRFPLPRMLREASGPGEYEIALRLEDGENELVQSINRTITPPTPPGWLERYGLVLVAVIGVALVGTLGTVLFLRSRPRRREIPLPFNPATMIRQEPPQPAKRPEGPPARPAIQPTGAKQISPGGAPPRAQKPAEPPIQSLPTLMAGSQATQVAGSSDATVLHDERRRRVRIKVLRTLDPGQVREQVLELPCSIGREGTDFTITGDPKISRRHAEIKEEGSVVMVVDHGSTNGTWVHDNQLRSAATALDTRGTVRLGPNTVLEVEVVP